VRFKSSPVLSGGLSGLTTTPFPTCTKSCTSRPGTPPIPGDLARLIQAWDMLPGSVRAHITGMVEGVAMVTGGGGEGEVCSPKRQAKVP
jgi:hypothetical protein